MSPSVVPAECWAILGRRSVTRRNLQKDEQALIEEIVELASQYGRYGYRSITAVLKHRAAGM